MKAARALFSMYRWTNETPTRVPLSDWYDTKNGKQVGFAARSVVGGVYIKALSDADTASKWNRINRDPDVSAKPAE